MPSKKRPKKPPEPFWDAIVSTWFRFCITFYSEEPTFSGSAPRDLKLIVESLRHRAEKKSIQWTEESATARLWSFLKEAYNDDWLKNNFLLYNINRQKDKIFFNAAKNAMHEAGK